MFPSALLPRRALGVAVVALATAPKSARAHAILEASQPQAGGRVPAGPVTLRLRYNSRIDRARSRLVLTGPDQAKATLAIAPDGPPEIVEATVTLAPGAYVLRWQVLAIDGHITRGDLPFSVTGP